jgi:hypothetical protein
MQSPRADRQRLNYWPGKSLSRRKRTDEHHLIYVLSSIEPALGACSRRSSLIHRQRSTLVNFPHIDGSPRPVDGQESRNGDSSSPRPDACSGSLVQSRRSGLRGGEIFYIREVTRKLGEEQPQSVPCVNGMTYISEKISS